MVAVIISSGHGKHVPGASGYLVEVDEARNVVDQVAVELNHSGVEVLTFHDDTSTDQQTNLETIVGFHNAHDRSLDVSVHFNAFQTTPDPMGTECCYLTDLGLANAFCAALHDAGGFINRGSKFRDDLYFLNMTEMPAVLIEVCFVDSYADAELYHKNFTAICRAIAEVLGGVLKPAMVA